MCTSHILNYVINDNVMKNPEQGVYLSKCLLEPSICLIKNI